MSYPVVWHFLAGLTDTLGYLFIVLGLFLIKKHSKDNMYAIAIYFLTIFLGTFVRESVIITIPLWLYIMYREHLPNWRLPTWSIRRRLYEILYISIPVFIVSFSYLTYYGIRSKTYFALPPANWWFVTLLCLIPFVPFVLMWGMEIEDKIYSLLVILYSIYALFFVFYDGRFLVLGYPIWVAYNLKVIEKWYIWIINEKDLTDRTGETLEHG